MIHMKQKKKITIIKQVATLFAIAVLITGFFNYFAQYNVAETAVKNQAETAAKAASEEVFTALKEYPAYIWLLHYWHENWDDLDIEYDVDYKTGTETKEKCQIFSERHPDLQIKYLTVKEARALPEEDQKLFAEITYSWLITHINEIKQTDNIAFLFCAQSDEPYKKQFFLFSAADPGAVRGTDYEQVYTLGVQKGVSDSQQEAMKQARENNSYLASAGEYMDYYEYVGTFDAQPVFIGITYDRTVLRQDISIQTWIRSIIAALFLICLAVLCLWMISRAVLKPLQEVQQSIRRYTETKDSSLVIADLDKFNAENEIGSLANDVKVLSTEIDHYLKEISEITAEKERLGAELELAARIQANSLPNIFPPFPEREEFNIYAAMDPAKEVGGDFYDFYMIDDDHLAVLIADVSGKGIPAALFMMTSKIMINNASANNMSPSDIIEKVNNQICAHNPEEMFVSVWMGILEVSTGKIVATNAGHEYPAARTPGGQFELIEGKHDFVVGGMEGIKYREKSMQMEPGTTLFLYTDGVPEATNSEGEMFGTDRMVEALNRNPEGGPEEILAEVREAVDEFVKDAEQFDDLTMLCLTYVGPEAKAK